MNPTDMTDCELAAAGAMIMAERQRRWEIVPHHYVVEWDDLRGCHGRMVYSSRRKREAQVAELRRTIGEHLGVIRCSTIAIRERP